jgi:hypothetical protein
MPLIPIIICFLGLSGASVAFGLDQRQGRLEDRQRYKSDINDLYLKLAEVKAQDADHPLLLASKNAQIKDLENLIQLLYAENQRLSDEASYSNKRASA